MNTTELSHFTRVISLVHCNHAWPVAPRTPSLVCLLWPISSSRSQTRIGSATSHWSGMITMQQCEDTCKVWQLCSGQTSYRLLRIPNLFACYRSPVNSPYFYLRNVLRLLETFYSKQYKFIFIHYLCLILHKYSMIIKSDDSIHFVLKFTSCWNS